MDEDLNGIFYDEENDSYYQWLFKLMAKNVEHSEYIFISKISGLKIQAVFKPFEEFLTKYVKNKCIELVRNSLEQFRKGDGKLNMFTYLKNATFHEAFDLDVFMPSILSKHDSSVYKSERKTLLNDLFIFIQKNQGDNAVIAEALISYLCKAQVFAQKLGTTHGYEFENYTSRHGLGLNEIVYLSLEQLFAVWEHFMKTGNEDNKKEFRQMKRLYKNGMPMRNMSLHETKAGSKLYRNFMKTHLSTLVNEKSDVANNEIEKNIDELVKNLIRTILDNRPQDTLNDEFDGCLHLTIPSRNSSNYFLNMTYYKEELVQSNRTETGKVLQAIRKIEPLMRSFINGYVTGYEKILFSRTHYSMSRGTNLLKDGILQAYDMSTAKSIQATELKISFIYQYIHSQLAEKSESSEEDIVLTSTILGQVIEEKRSTDGISRHECFNKFISLQIMRDFSHKKYTGTANDKLGKVVQVMNDYLVHLNQLVKIAKRNKIIIDDGDKVVETLSSVVECVKTVWSRENTHFNFSILSPTIDEDYCAWMVNHSGFLQQTKKEIKANFFSLGARSAAADCKKDLEDKETAKQYREKINMFVESSEFKNRITAAINDLQIEPVTQPQLTTTERVGILFDVSEDGKNIVNEIQQLNSAFKITKFDETLTDEETKKIIYVKFSNRRIAQQLIEMFEAGSKDLRELGARAIGLESHIQLMLEYDETLKSENRKLRMFNDDKSKSPLRCIKDIKSNFKHVETACYDPVGKGFYVVFKSREAARNALQCDDYGIIYWAKSKMLLHSHFNFKEWKTTIERMEFTEEDISKHERTQRDKQAIKKFRRLQREAHELKFDEGKRKAKEEKQQKAEKQRLIQQQQHVNNDQQSENENLFGDEETAEDPEVFSTDSTEENLPDCWEDEFDNNNNQGPHPPHGVSRKRKLASRENAAKKRRLELLDRKIQKYEKKIRQLDDILFNYYNQE